MFVKQTLDLPSHGRESLGGILIWKIESAQVVVHTSRVDAVGPHVSLYIIELNMEECLLILVLGHIVYQSYLLFFSHQF